MELRAWVQSYSFKTHFFGPKWSNLGCLQSSFELLRFTIDGAKFVFRNVALGLTKLILCLFRVYKVSSFSSSWNHNLGNWNVDRDLFWANKVVSYTNWRFWAHKWWVVWFVCRFYRFLSWTMVYFLKSCDIVLKWFYTMYSVSCTVFPGKLLYLLVCLPRNELKLFRPYMSSSR